MTSLSCPSHAATPSQGDCVRLQADDQLYQVIGVDDRHDRCWLRRWPLARQGSEVFEISLQQVRPARPHRP
jgi:hypothetical protein